MYKVRVISLIITGGTDGVQIVLLSGIRGELSVTKCVLITGSYMLIYCFRSERERSALHYIRLSIYTIYICIHTHTYTYMYCV